MTSDRVAKYEEAKVLLAKINETLKRSDLTAAEREQLQIHAASLSGQLMSTWLPVSWGRRLIMLAIVAFGIQQAVWYQNYEAFFWWILLPFFSPRIVGEVAGLLGTLSRNR